MTTEVITSATQVTPTWLTQLLREKGCLTMGEVVKVTQKERYDMFSTSIVLEAAYSSDASEATPERFFLKMSQPETQPLNNREVMFYTQVAIMMPESPAVRCYDAAYDAEAGSYHLLLEDVSQTHFSVTHPLPPPRFQAEQMVDLLARFHAFWWDHPRLGEDAGALVTDCFIKNYIKLVENKFEQFVDFMGDRLSSKRKKMYEQAFARHPTLLIERIVNQKHITFVHGDAHTWNFLLPKADNDGRIYLIDWHTFDFEPQCWLGAGDLAYMICHYWYPERRQELEKELLGRYYRRLLEYGVADYSWNALWYDYKLSAILSLYIPVLRSNPHLGLELVSPI